MIALLGLGLAGALVCIGLAPAVVNGDGLGYLKAQAVLALYPGHLGYVPLLAGLRALFHLGPRPVDTLFAARLLSALSAGVAAIALGAAAERLIDRRGRRERERGVRGRWSAKVVAAAGLAASFGTLGSGSDVESYAPALAALCVALYLVARRRTGGGLLSLLGAALAIAVAVLFHVENVLFALPCALALQRRDRAWLLGVSGALTLACYAPAIVYHGGGWHGLGWILGASHGFHYPLRLTTPAIALYGACKALVYAPYPYEASWTEVLVAFALGAAALGALLATIFARDPDRETALPLGGAATLAWAGSYGAVGVAFFASDAERWIFLLPLLWLSAASAPRFRSRVLAIAGLLLACNLALILPRARDATDRTLARAAARHTHAGDLVISPGHSWDEYLGFYDGPPVESFPLVYYAAKLGGEQPLEQALHERVSAARVRGAAVLLVRFDGGKDPLGWKELAHFGITPENVAVLLPPGPRVALGDGVSAVEAQ